MFGRKTRISRSLNRSGPSAGAFIEVLEDRRLLSASGLHHAVHTHVEHSSRHATAKTSDSKTSLASAITRATQSTSTSDSGSSSGSTTAPVFPGGPRGLVTSLEFDQTPAAVQSGLQKLASTDSLAAPTSTQTVYLGNSNGVETYTLVYTSSGTTSRITVDQTGAAVTQPTQSTTTWAVLDGTGAGSDSAAAAEITAIANALGLTAPTSTTVVNVTTQSDGSTVYSVNLGSSNSSSSSTARADRGRTISVNSAGDPVGDQVLPFSVLPTAVQDGINANVPAGDSALSASSTQNVDVRTTDGVTTYSVTFSSTGIQTVVTVNTAGDLTSLPSQSTTEFSDLPTAAQTELQTLATDKGYTSTISSTQTVDVFTETSGTIIYSVTLNVTGGTSTAATTLLTIAVDQSGNPTVPPTNFGGGFGGGGGCENMGGGSGFDGNGFGGSGLRRAV